MAQPETRPFQLQESVFETIEPAGRLAELVAYWRRLVPNGLPGRQHVDPIVIGSTLLPHVFLADVLEGARRFRWRLIGTHIVNHAASDDTGRDLDTTIASEMRETIIGHYREVAALRKPICHRSEFIGRDRRIYRYERALMPLATDGTTVDMILGGAVFGHLQDRGAD